MEAGSKSSRNIRLVWLWYSGFAVVQLVGLWQGYGAWFFLERPHGP